LATSPTDVAADASPPAFASTAPGRKGSTHSAPTKPGVPQTPAPVPSSRPRAAPDPSHPLFFPQ
jgi:hypothetical protein